MKRLILAPLLLALLAADSVPNPKVSLDVRGASISDVLALLAKESGANVVADQSIRQQHVTLRLFGVRFLDALQILASAHGLIVERHGDVLIVGTPESMNRSNDAAQNGVHTRIVQLQHASPEDVSKALLAVLPVGTIAIADHRLNAVLVTADAAALERAQTIAAALDGAPTVVLSRYRSQSYRLRYTGADDVAKELKELLPDGTFVADDEQNAVVVTGDDDAQTAASHAIANLDVAGPEVLLEVRVADVTPQNDSTDIGLEFGGVVQGTQTTGATEYAFTGGSLSVNVTLNALVSKGKAEILATPRLVTLNGKEADLLIGETYPVVYSTSVLGGENVQFVDVGVKLRLTPIIGPDGSVTAELHPEYSEIEGFTSTGYPIITNRKVDSTLRVHDGQTIVLGGLLRDTSSVTVQSLPWLSDIPIIGKLFQNKQTARERDEIVFLITPHIIDPQAPPSK